MGHKRGATPRQGLQLVAAGMSLIAVCYGLARFAFGLFVPQFRAEFGLDGATVGAISAGSYVAYCVGIVGSSLATGRFGARAVAVSAGVVAAVGTGVIATAPNALVLGVGMFAAGASTGIASPPMADVVASTIREPRRDLAQTVVNAGSGLGVAVSGPVALLAGEQWRLAWGLFAVVAVAVTAWVAFAASAAREHLPTARPQGPHTNIRPKVPRGAARIVVAAAVMGAGSAAVWTFSQDLLVSDGRQSQSEASLAWIVLGVAGLAGAFAGGVIARFGLKLSWMVLLLVLGVTTALLPMAARVGIAVVILDVLFGGAYVALTGVLLVWSARLFARAPAMGVGVAFAAIAVGQASAVAVFGWLADAASYQVVFGVAAGVALLGLTVGPPRMDMK